MRNLLESMTLACTVAVPLAFANIASAQSLLWKRISSVPDRAGFGWPFAGVLGGKLLVAGGANFPDQPPWASGAKKWYDDIYLLAKPDGKWEQVGKLPRPLGYGVSVTTPEGVICCGGSDPDRHYRDTFLLNLDDERVKIQSLAPLPRPMANGSAALLGKTIYIAGGLESPTATRAMKNFWALDLSARHPVWRELEPWPGPARMLAVVAVLKDTLYVVSGTELSGDAEGKPVRRYLTDVYAFRADSGWKRLTDIPRAAVAAPSPAPVIGSAKFLIISGDDGTKLGFQPPEMHPGFARDVLAYDARQNTWSTFGQIAGPTQVTVPVVKWKSQFVLPNGEIRPGIRTPEVWALRVK